MFSDSHLQIHRTKTCPRTTGNRSSALSSSPRINFGVLGLFGRQERLCPATIPCPGCRKGPGSCVVPCAASVQRTCQILTCCVRGKLNSWVLLPDLAREHRVSQGTEVLCFFLAEFLHLSAWEHCFSAGHHATSEHFYCHCSESNRKLWEIGTESLQGKTVP